MIRPTRSASRPTATTAAPSYAALPRWRSAPRRHRRAPGHLLRRHLGRLRDLHQDGLPCGREFDSGVLKFLLHAPVELALHRPAPAVGATDLADDRDHRAVDLVDAPQFES